MNSPIEQKYVIETEDGWYYKEEVYIYFPNGERKIIETTDDIIQAKHFEVYSIAMNIAKAYNFKLLTLNTYVEGVD